MYRERIHMTVRDRDGWNVAVDASAQINTICTRLGVPTGTLWTETVGPFNQLTWDIDHATLASYEQAQTVLRGDGDWQKQVGRIIEVSEPGKGWTELLETVTAI
jgi:hypothetical protein